MWLTRIGVPPLPLGWSQPIDEQHNAIRHEAEGDDPPLTFGDGTSSFVPQPSHVLWTEPLTVEGAEVILRFETVLSGGLNITFPNGDGFPYIVLPFQLCADIFRSRAQ
jgi:hypothetical protein